jgi:DNA-binding Xre family transcriptional regulator
MPQMITTPSGEEMVLLSRAEYDRLVALAAEAEEDAADVAAYDEAMSELAAGRDGPLPEPVSALVLKGASLLTAVRKWRGLKQTELAERAGISQGFLSDLESGRRRGAAETLQALAEALNVPPHWLA